MRLLQRGGEDVEWYYGERSFFTRCYFQRHFPISMGRKVLRVLLSSALVRRSHDRPAAHHSEAR